MNDSSKRDICILVVDDEREMREMIVDYLDGEGYGTLSARNGRESLAKLLCQRC